jgi:hypothetical protein
MASAVRSRMMALFGTSMWPARPQALHTVVGAGKRNSVDPDASRVRATTRTAPDESGTG